MNLTSNFVGGAQCMDFEEVYYTEDFETDDYFGENTGVEHGQDYSSQSSMTLPGAVGGADHMMFGCGPTTHIDNTSAAKNSKGILASSAFPSNNNWSQFPPPLPQSNFVPSSSSSSSSSVTMPVAGDSTRVRVEMSLEMIVLLVRQFLANEQGIVFEYQQAHLAWCVQHLVGREFCAFTLNVSVGTEGASSPHYWLSGTCCRGDHYSFQMIYAKLLESLQNCGQTPSSSSKTMGSRSRSRSASGTTVASPMLEQEQQQSQEPEESVSNLAFYSSAENLPVLDGIICSIADSSCSATTHGSSAAVAVASLESLRQLSDLSADVSLLELLFSRKAVDVLVAQCVALTPSSTGECPVRSQELRRFALLALANMSAHAPALHSMQLSAQLIQLLVNWSSVDCTESDPSSSGGGALSDAFDKLDAATARTQSMLILERIISQLQSLDLAARGNSA